MIGKRKRDTSVVPRSTTVDEEEPTPTTADSSAHDVFRRYFEAQFQPLELPGGPVPREAEIEEDEDEDDESEESDSGSEWGGVSEPEDGDNNVEVVEHDSSNNSADIMDKKARKAFMVCFYNSIYRVRSIELIILLDREVTGFLFGLDYEKEYYTQG